MAIISAYTKAQQDIILNQTIVSGAMSGDNLVLTRKNGATFNAGNVRGPQGYKGETGEVDGELVGPPPLSVPTSWTNVSKNSPWIDVSPYPPLRYRVRNQRIEFDGFTRWNSATPSSSFTSIGLIYANLPTNQKELNAILNGLRPVRCVLTPFGDDIYRRSIVIYHTMNNTDWISFSGLSCPNVDTP